MPLSRERGRKQAMHYHQYYPVDVINGPGTRATLFVSGCEHQCPGCYNQSTGGSMAASRSMRR